MTQFPQTTPERFAFELRFPEFRDAIDIVRMTGEADTIKFVLGAKSLALVRERNGIVCTAEAPIQWRSVPWNGDALQFTTKVALFDKLLRHDIAWDIVEVTGSYPGAALDVSSAERGCLLRVQMGDTTLQWPLTFDQSLTLPSQESAASPSTVSARVLSQAMTLVAQVALPKHSESSPLSAAAFGNGRAHATGRVARIVHHDGLTFDLINIRCSQLKDLAYVLERMAGQPQLIRNGRRTIFATQHARCSFETSDAAPNDLSEVEGLLPICQTDLPTAPLSADLAKITSQSSLKDDLVWWRTESASRAVRLTMPVIGGDAMVTLDTAETLDQELPDLDLLFNRRALSTLCPLGRAKTTTLSYYPDMIMSRQVYDGTTVKTFIRPEREQR